MPDLATRTQREQEIAAALLFVLRRHAEQAGRVGLAYDWQAMHADVRQALIDPLSTVFLEAAMALQEQHGQVVAEAEIRRWAAQWARGYSSALADSIVETTRDDMARAMELTPGEQALALAAIVVGMSARAENVGITETTRAISVGESWISERWRLAGKGLLTPVWYTELDARVCEVCAPLHGAGPEVFDRVSLGGPPSHPRCRCWLVWEET